MKKQKIIEATGLPTPYYAYDLSFLRSTLNNAKTEAERRGYNIHYAIKANAQPQVLKEIRRVGFGIDCVYSEILVPFPPAKIITFNLFNPFQIFFLIKFNLFNRHTNNIKFFNIIIFIPFPYQTNSFL